LSARLPTLGRNWLSGDLGGAVAAVVEPVASGERGLACLNAHVAMTAVRDERLGDGRVSARPVFADGAPIAWLARHRAAIGSQRIASLDLAGRLVRAGHPMEQVRAISLARESPAVCESLGHKARAPRTIELDWRCTSQRVREYERVFRASITQAVSIGDRTT
jgi:UDP-N-acetyl-D-mannosaminuronic acid transferase (WecB/TagA/CpsF family)